MSQTFSFNGQKLQYNHNNKTAYTVIDEAFYSAGKKLGWEKKEPGLGFNLSIIDFVLKVKCHLVVKVNKANAYYWIYFDTLKQFLDTHQCDYTISGVNLKVISWKKFIRLQEHAAL